VFSVVTSVFAVLQWWMESNSNFSKNNTAFRNKGPNDCWTQMQNCSVAPVRSQRNMH